MDLECLVPIGTVGTFLETLDHANFGTLEKSLLPPNAPPRYKRRVVINPWPKCPFVIVADVKIARSREEPSLDARCSLESALSQDLYGATAFRAFDVPTTPGTLCGTWATLAHGVQRNCVTLRMKCWSLDTSGQGSTRVMVHDGFLNGIRILEGRTLEFVGAIECHGDMELIDDSAAVGTTVFVASGRKICMYKEGEGGWTHIRHFYPDTIGGVQCPRFLCMERKKTQRKRKENAKKTQKKNNKKVWNLPGSHQCTIRFGPSP